MDFVDQAATVKTYIIGIMAVYVIFLVLRWSVGGDFSTYEMDGNRLLLTRANCFECTRRRYFVPRTQITGIHLGRAIPFMDIVCALLLLVVYARYADYLDSAVLILPAALSIRILWKINIIELEVMTSSCTYRSKRACETQSVEILASWLFENPSASPVSIYSASAAMVASHSPPQRGQTVERPAAAHQNHGKSDKESIQMRGVGFEGGQMMQQPMQGGQMMQQPMQFAEKKLQNFSPSADFWDAAKKGNMKYVSDHLDGGQDVNKRKHWGWKTALHIAAIEGHRQMCELLLYRGADVTLKSNGMTAADVAKTQEIRDLILGWQSTSSEDALPDEF